MVFSLFKKNPEKLLAKSAALLGKGELDRALKLALEVVEGGKGDQVSRAQDLAKSAREAIVAEAERSAERSIANGVFHDAADWLSTALPHMSEAEAEETRARIERLQEQAEEAAAAAEAEAEAAAEKPEVENAPPMEDIDEEIHFQTLVAMMRPDLAEAYEARSADFRSTYVRIAEGKTLEAIDDLNALLERYPDDKIYHLERARCLLMLGKPEAALEDLEVVGDRFGDKAVDLADRWSVPGLRADALLRLERATEVVELLKELGKPEHGLAHLTLDYSLALEKTGQLEQAVEVLAQARKKFKGDPWFPFHLARLLDELGDWEKAIEILEQAIAPSLSPGCAAPPKHIVSFRYLIALYLGNKQEIERVGDLLGHLEDMQQGRLTAADLRLVAAYHRQLGDEDAAAEAEAAAENAKGLNP